jgi:uncharacterized protein YjiS (DUF1127 family)
MGTHDLRNALQFGILPALALARVGAAALAGALRRRIRQRARRRMAQSTEQWLAGLDTRGLRDLGLTRSEIRSIASEAAGDTEATRRPIAMAHR